MGKAIERKDNARLLYFIEVKTCRNKINNQNH